MPVNSPFKALSHALRSHLMYVQDVEGEVMAWDQATKVLIIKSESTTRSNLSNVQIINLDFVSDVKVMASSEAV